MFEQNQYVGSPAQKTRREEPQLLAHNATREHTLAVTMVIPAYLHLSVQVRCSTVRGARFIPEQPHLLGSESLFVVIDLASSVEQNVKQSAPDLNDQ